MRFYDLTKEPMTQEFIVECLKQQCCEAAATGRIYIRDFNVDDDNEEDCE